MVLVPVLAEVGLVLVARSEDDDAEQEFDHSVWQNEWYVKSVGSSQSPVTSHHKRPLRHWELRRLVAPYLYGVTAAHADRTISFVGDDGGLAWTLAGLRPTPHAPWRRLLSNSEPLHVDRATKQNQSARKTMGF